MDFRTRIFVLLVRTRIDRMDERVLLRGQSLVLRGVFAAQPSLMTRLLVLQERLVGAELCDETILVIFPLVNSLCSQVVPLAIGSDFRLAALLRRACGRREGGAFFVRSSRASSSAASARRTKLLQN